MKIQIIGYSGCGKSTLAKTLGEYYNIPYLHLDNVQFYGDWKQRTNEEQNRIVRDFLKTNENWIIDGNYSIIAHERFEMSDITILLIYNRFFCYRMCRNRYKEFKGKSRGSFPCEERFDFEFKKWILFSGRTKKRRIRHQELLNSTKGEKYIFRNRKQLNNWLKSIGIIQS